MTPLFEIQRSANPIFTYACLSAHPPQPALLSLFPFQAECDTHISIIAMQFEFVLILAGVRLLPQTPGMLLRIFLSTEPMREYFMEGTWTVASFVPPALSLSFSFSLSHSFILWLCKHESCRDRTLILKTNRVCLHCSFYPLSHAQHTASVHPWSAN